MGEYAEMSIDRDFGNYINDIDRYYNEVGEADYPFDFGPKERKEAPQTCAFKEFPEGDSVLLRCDYDWGKKLNRVCIIEKKTEKAILFKIDREIEKDIDKDFLFWIPKSTIYMKENEKNVYWIRDWVTIKNINK